MTQEVKATEAAERKAEELGVTLAEVEGTGAGGKVTVEDVEAAAKALNEHPPGEDAPDEEEEEAAEEGPDEEVFEAKLNPDLGNQLSVRIGDKVYENGTPVTESEYEGLKVHRSGPSVEHPSGVQYVLKGKKITAS